jgi:asparagine synthase (glutamine-hydrolysing)
VVDEEKADGVNMARRGVRARIRRRLDGIKRVTRRVRELFHKSTLPPALADVALRVRREGLTYLSLAKLDKLGHAVLTIEKNGVPGVVIEAGCALGGSAMLLASAKHPTRPLRVYDVFGMIPPPTEKDGDDVHDRYKVIASGKSRGLKGQRYYGYETDLYQRVQKNFERAGLPLEANSIEMIAGHVEATLEVDEPVSLAHIDVDWYEPVITSLERIAPRLSAGGVIVLDDYYDWSGCRQATDDFLARTRIPFLRDSSAGSMALIRK